MKDSGRLLVVLYLLLNVYALKAQMFVSFDSISVSSICNGRNLVDENHCMGEILIRTDGNTDTITYRDCHNDDGSLTCRVTEAISLKEYLTKDSDHSFLWRIEIHNNSFTDTEITDLAFRLPFCSVNQKYTPIDNLYRHESINCDASYLYWSPFSGQGECILMTPENGTGIEFANNENWFFIHSSTSVDRKNDSWRLASTSSVVPKGKVKRYGFRFTVVSSQKEIPNAIFENNGVDFRVVPGMVVPVGKTFQFALRSKEPINSIIPEDVSSVSVISKRKSPIDGFNIYSASFFKLGENYLEISYGNGKTMRLDFFVTENLKTVISKRASFIVNNQQHKDSSKWYNGLYSLYNRENRRLLSPDSMEGLSKYMVGGSDDPSNSKPVYISEKNAILPNPEEIASLEYYEKNFVWGKLQRTDTEYPYPYGIYGSDNWWENRSGQFGDYQSGGSGKERMWRTFDYVTHIAIYYNLYRIARDNPSYVTYLDANAYLDRAFNTAMAYFQVPYNIKMGNQWNFHGWCDWAYKQGNFHERYILDLINALEENDRGRDALRLRREWEKKVTYMVYENPWPFGSEMFVDRTAFESSYYVGEYALKQPMTPQQQFWYDKNLDKWYTYTDYPEEAKQKYMLNQLRSNLTLRGIYEPSYQMCGTAWNDRGMTLDYMSQMGAVALLDYGTRFADNPEDIIRFGYNSLLSSWALVDTTGAAGWFFSTYQHCKTWVDGKEARRQPLIYDGEIDHGFTGAIHGAGCYLVNDPLFGTVAYGADVRDMKKHWQLDIYDGIGQIIAIPQKDHFEMRLENNGIHSAVTIAKDLSYLSFTIEKRIETECQRIRFHHLPEGEYEVVDSKKHLLTTFTSLGDVCDIRFNLTGELTHLTIQKKQIF